MDPSGVPLTSAQLFEVAEQIERSGAEFYRWAASILPAGDLRGLMLDLAQMEAGHIRVFEHLRAAAALAPQAPSAASEDALLYLRALADEQIFQLRRSPLERLGGLHSTDAVLALALQFERDSVAYYVGLRKLATDPETDAQVELVLDEELKHVSLLAHWYRKLAPAPKG